ncbi:MAG TPA: FecR family protein [Candidatus Sulfotelmatobacter sp.]|nr:FecR family protein [Candidatus Sulfotelmatobacter sp.]
MHTPFRFSLTLSAVAILALPAFANSQARIVRLSDVQGSVEINKNTGSGFEKAFVNLPITQGTELRTGQTGRAEVEFEDGSSMRLSPNTTVQFTALSLSDSGQRVSNVNLVDGMGYVNWLGKDDLTLNFSREKVQLDHAAHFRVDTSPEVADLAVFKGDLNVEGPNGQLSVEKKKTAIFDVADNDKSKIEHKVSEEPLDAWDKESVSYHDEYAKNNRADSPYGYGLSDLNYYGAYSMVPGYGMMWQPYFTGIGWDPFMDGAWGFYPGMGYMFASAYPWGWMPYRYGSWMFVPSAGWMWQPGGWNNWVGTPVYRPTNLAHVTPLVPPAAGTTRTVLVGRAATAPNVMSPRMTLTAGSAGLGVPRGSFSNLNHLNHQVAKTGFARVEPTPQFAATAPARSAALARSSGAYGGSREGRGESRGSMGAAPMGHSASPSGGGHPSGGGSHR